MPFNAISPQSKLHPRHRFGMAFVIVLLGLAVWFISSSDPGPKPSVTLPDGVRLEFYGGSKGKLIRMGEYAAYEHPVPAEVRSSASLWERLRKKLPQRISSHLPVGNEGQNYPNSPSEHDMELQFRYFGEFGHEHRDISVVDGDGRDIPIHSYRIVDDRRKYAGAAQSSGWLRIGWPHSVHCENLRVRFRLPGGTPEMRRAADARPYTEISGKNPFFVGPAMAGGDPLPATRPFPGGNFILEKTALYRTKVAYSGYTRIEAEFTLKDGDRLLDDYVVREVEMADDFGAYHMISSYSKSLGQGRHRVDITAALRSDALWCRVRFKLRHSADSRTPLHSRTAQFNNLPLPESRPLDMKREVIVDGIAVRLGNLVLQDTKERIYRANLTATCQPGSVEVPHRVIRVIEGSDDQGRTQVPFTNGWKAAVAQRLPDGFGNGITVLLPVDAKSWNLTLAVEDVTEVEFAIKMPQPKERP